MISLNAITQISEFEWEIPRTFREDMRGPVRLFCSSRQLEHSQSDKSLEQAVNATTLPGLAGSVVVMPDMHQGYGFPIGGIAATDYPAGVISPGAIGYDINCGVRLLASSIQAETVRSWLPELANHIYTACPSGVGGKGILKVSRSDLDRILLEGAQWTRKHGYAGESDLLHTEETGSMEGADPGKVSPRAKERGLGQVGSLGAGNHFIEIDLVESIFDHDLARSFGLEMGCLAVQIHCGSRGLGHQVCTDYVQEFQTAVRRYQITLPDRELVCAPLESPEGRAYLAAMRAAANYAFVNRQVLAHAIRRSFEVILSGKVKRWQLHQVYDVCHNMGKVETHEIDGQRKKVCLHRKGATRAVGPHTPGLPDDYQQTGQPVLVPGSMGTASWVLTGTQKAMTSAWRSCCHGAGRSMSRAKARQETRGDVILRKLESAGIQIRAGSLAGLAEETPSAYKDVDEVVRVVASAGIARQVARLRPLVVIKG
jgi:tRNA-splicing ligase RtcB